MARKQQFTKEQYAAMPPDMQALLVADGDNYVFEFETTEDVGGLKSALNKEKTDAAAFKKQLDALRGTLGDRKPEDIQALLDAAAKAEEDKLKVQGDWDKMKAQMLTEIEEKQLKPLTAERDKLRGAVEKYLVEAALTQAISAAGAFPGAEKALLPSLKPYVKVVEKDGEFQAQTWNPATDTQYLNEKGEGLDFATLIDTKFRKDEIFGRLFQPSGGNGSGASHAGNAGNGNGNKTINRAAFDKLPPVQQMELMKGGTVPVD